MSSKREYLEARDELITELQKELLGPGSGPDTENMEYETINSHPVFRYLTGILYPNYQNTEKNTILDDQLAFFEDDLISDPDEELEEDIGNSIYDSSKFRPSAFGMTFLVDGNTDSVSLNLKLASYENISVTDSKVPLDVDIEIPSELKDFVELNKEENYLFFKNHSESNLLEEKYDQLKNLNLSESETDDLSPFFELFKQSLYSYKRNPKEKSFTLDFRDSDFTTIEDKFDFLKGNIKLTGFRKKIDDLWSITIMMSNETDQFICQPKITVSTEGNNFIFSDKNLINKELLSEEELEMEMLYHDVKSYGQGHGVSVDWDIDERGFGNLQTNFIPIKEVPSITFEPEEKYSKRNYELSMKYYSTLDNTNKQDKLKSLKNFIDSYNRWIDDLNIDIENLPETFMEVGLNNARKCKEVKSRMDRGLEILQTNQTAYEAFQLANQAMFIQRVHLNFQSELSEINDYNDRNDCITEFITTVDYNNCEPNEGLWRPFQLAFLLISIDSIVDPQSEERSIVDLIWLPTGGGKTEAYLGLIAFTIFYDRLKYGKDAYGTLVIMRYTLRLLTSQQFERAATLICACEYIRENYNLTHRKDNLGQESITIGLWIGSEHTPNSKDTAENHIKELKKIKNTFTLKENIEKYNKFQVLKCPYCGTSMVKSENKNELIGDWGYKSTNTGHFYMSCPNEDCFFNDELPIQVVDDELYRKPPTLLFSTVDKFAMLPWKGDAQNFFGKKSGMLPPQLIIQDELHLISGALGSVVGIYETAIDYICSKNGSKPKIIASTATIKKAKEQCALLYDRDVRQFPPSGISYDDTYFYRYQKIDHSKDQFGRIYLGIFNSGMSQISSEIKIISSLLQLVYSEEWSDEVKDKFWTLVTYFNSLRDLGNIETETNGRIQESIIALRNRKNFDGYRKINNHKELNSRKKTPVLVETMDDLGKIKYLGKPNYDLIDLVYATNMISVGLDIPRLNLLLVQGQPKLTSEYIQVTSRIGRQFPGLVLMHYNQNRSRDRSNYEKFISQHSTLYKFVEPSSVTPFSIPTRERALHSVLVEMIRGKNPREFAKDNDAKKFNQEEFKAEIDEIKNFIITRIKSTYKRINRNSLVDPKRVEKEINDIFSTWEIWAKRNEKFIFGSSNFNPKSGHTSSLLVDFNNNFSEGYRTLTSMRNIDSEVTGKIRLEEDRDNNSE